MILLDALNGEAQVVIIGERGPHKFVERVVGKHIPPRQIGHRHLLARHGATGTFFILGWVAERQPAMVKTIEKEETRLDVLVNNAAVEVILPFEKTDFAKADEIWWCVCRLYDDHPELLTSKIASPKE